MKDPLSLTKYWLEKIIIDLDLCPFAKIPFKQGLIRVQICEAVDENEKFQAFLEECESLLLYGPEKIATTILAFPNSNEDFLSFNDFVGYLEDSLETYKLNTFFQVVAFHPGFYFEGVPEDDLANFVNRSPYPIVHIIRVSDMEKAKNEVIGGEQISYFNEEKLKSLSEQKIKELFFYLF